MASLRLPCLRSSFLCLGFVGACWWLSATPAHAQAADRSAPSSPWYGGANASLEVHLLTIDEYDTGGALYAGTVYGGYYFTPNLALQVGILYGRGKLNEDQQHVLWGLPVQLRAGLSRPARRLQVDALARATVAWVHREERRYSYPTNPQVQLLPRQHGVNLLLAAGVGFRYGLGNHLQVTADLLGSTNPRPSVRDYLGFNLGCSTALGLSYRL